MIRDTLGSLEWRMEYPNERIKLPIIMNKTNIRKTRVGERVLLMIDLLSSIISFLAEWFLLLGSFMVGSFVIWGRGWAKLRPNREFIEFWDFIKYLFAFTIVLTISLMFLTPIIERLLYLYSAYLAGITSAITGIFFVWIVYTGDFDIRTQWKWLFVVICFAILALNILVVNYFGIRGIGFWIN